MIRTAAVTILYNPDGNVLENILSYLPFVELLIVAYNSSTSNIPDELKNNDKVLCIHDGENKGIAERLNQAAETAINKGFEWLLTMDQDSSFNNNEFKNYINDVDNFHEKNMVAMFGVEYENNKTTKETYQNVHFLITSGSLVNLSLFEKIGKFDEKLFIDNVDLEYCLRAISKGYKIVKVSNTFLQHQLGEVKQFRSLKNGKKTERVLHSPIRLYYMTRNYFYLKRDYKIIFPKEMNQLKKDLLIRIKNNLLYGNSRIKTINYIRKAIKDFQNNKTGKIENEVY